MGSLKQLLDYVRQLFALTQTLEENKREIKELRQEVEQLTGVVRHLAYDLRFSLNDEKHEREKLVLKLENEMLKFERRLPPSKEPEAE